MEKYIESEQMSPWHSPLVKRQELTPVPHPAPTPAQIESLVEKLLPLLDRPEDKKMIENAIETVKHPKK